MPRPCKHTEYIVGCFICQEALACTERAQKYRQRWGEPEPDCSSEGQIANQGQFQPTKTGSQPIKAPQAGPGTELTKLLKEFGINSQEGCACKSRALTMDQWGVKGCKEKREEIVAWLREEAGKRSWTEKLKAATIAIAQGIAFQLDVSDLYGSLVDLAIRRAEGVT